MIEDKHFVRQTLEEHERRKYNFLVTQKGYGTDASGSFLDSRRVQIDRMVGDLGEVSIGFLGILSELKRNDSFKVLDIGCGTGGVIAWFNQKHGADVYGIDISDAFVNSVKSNFPFRENVFQGNANNLHMFEDNTFDLVCHLDGMEHIPDVWEKACLTEAVRVSKKYIFYENACGPALADEWAQSGNFTKVHINIKPADKWLSFYKNNAKRLNYEIARHYTHDSIDKHQAIILRKNT